ncbi:MAG: pentapeptide repeat-containing protein [Candidatus Methanoperedens sp.]|nr:pentapeptide repeat-containing protein [Candidatus Methanoperedens sp.]MCZ7394538.1 pentapeptide repeat-containing protein [Candidatus Methanoperedens sp.]
MKKEANSPVLELKFPDDSDEKDRTISAEEVVKAIKGGRSVEIENAVINEPFILKSANVEGEITIQRTRFKGPVDCSYADFKRVLNLKNSIFEADATFTEVTLEKDIFLDHATFLGGAEFSNITATGVFYSRLTKFKKATFREAAFKNIKFNKSTFEDEADFGSAQIGGSAEFVGVRFKKKANFNSIHIQGHAFFGLYDLFSWNKIPGKDDEEKLRESLKQYLGFDWVKQYLGFDWVKSANIEKTDDGKTIMVFNENNSISLKLNDEKTVTLEYDNETTELIARLDKNELKIYLPPVTFEDKAEFIGGEIGGSAQFTEAKFKKKADFNIAHIEGHAIFNQAIFVGDTDFALARFEKDAFFYKCNFERRADFLFARIGGVAQFTGVVFRESANFNSAQIDGAAFFNAATFEGDVNFVKARILGNAEFTGAKFKGYMFSWDNIPGNDSVRLIDFLKQNYGIDWVESAKIKKIDDAKTIKVSTEKNSILLRLNDEKTKAILTIDDGRTDEFIARSEDGKLNIHKGKANFNSAKIEGHAIFKSATFEDDGDFGDINISGEAVFTEATFKEKANFNSAHIGADADFKGTIFANDISFEDALFGKIDFGENGKLSIYQKVKIDLRGCEYNSIQPTSIWKPLMDHLRPYDRQPFTQLEQTFRRAGKDDLADDVYYEGRRRERKELEKINGWGWWLKDTILFCLTGYGVKVKKLLYFIVPILIVGAIIYHQPGAVVLKPDIKTPPMIQPQDSYFEAFWFCFNLFLPVEIPSGADWNPSSEYMQLGMVSINFTTIGTLLKIAGWILVPIGIAGISGILKRKSEV